MRKKEYLSYRRLWPEVSLKIVSLKNSLCKVLYIPRRQYILWHFDSYVKEIQCLFLRNFGKITSIGMLLWNLNQIYIHTVFSLCKEMVSNHYSLLIFNSFENSDLHFFCANVSSPYLSILFMSIFFINYSFTSESHI